MNAKTWVPTPNADVIYSMSYLDLKKTGPLVVNAPPRVIGKHVGERPQRPHTPRGARLRADARARDDGVRQKQRRRRYFVIIRLGAALAVCSAGEITNVTQAFQPSGRSRPANSQ